MRKTLIFCIIIFSSCLHSQNDANIQSLYSNLDNSLGYNNLELLNGTAYFEKYRTLNEKHPYLDGREFHDGAVMYDGQYYAGLKLRYDMFSDRLIISIDRSGNGNRIIQLIPELIESFEINDKLFVKRSAGDDGHAFYEELINSGCFKLFKKEKLSVQDRRDKSSLYYEFEIQRTNYYIDIQDSLIEPTLSNLINHFPQSENTIENLFKDQRKLRRSNYPAFLKNLMQLMEVSVCKRLKK